MNLIKLMSDSLVAGSDMLGLLERHLEEESSKLESFYIANDRQSFTRWFAE